MDRLIERRMSHAGPPLPVPRAGHRQPPLEARTNWDPWLPPTEAYPEVPRPLRAVTVLVLSVAAIVAMALMLGLM